MAIAASPNSKASVSAPVTNKRKNMASINVEEKEIASEMKSDNPKSQPKKRNSNPGVRVIHGRIYDSQNGTTCHQCRQKTYAVFVNCKNQAKARPCNAKYCRTCLLNRYGEKVEDVTLLEKWDCPKCKGVCNCSICMKRRGHQPTGMLVQMAKAGGFSSVSDLIEVKGAQNVSNYKRVKETTDSPRKLDASTEVIAIKSPKKPGKENLFDGKRDSNANPLVSVPPVENNQKKLKSKGSKEVVEGSVADKKPMKMKRKGVEVKPDGNVVTDVSATEANPVLNEKKQKKLKSKETKDTEVKPDGNVVTDGSVSEANPVLNEKKQKKLKSKGLKEIIEGNMINGPISKVNAVQPENEVKQSEKVHDQNANQQLENNQCLKEKNSSLHLFETVVPLPTGTELVSVAGVDLPKEDVGNALQLLEFCYTFGKILDVKKGQAEAVLRDLTKGRSTRRGKFTSVIQFHIQLLSVIQEELESESGSESDSPSSGLTHGNDSWLKALKSCMSKSKLKLMESIDLTPGGYNSLESSIKLRLLVHLCDEVLGTEKVRNWIDEQNVKFAEKRKEAKEKLSVAKDKEKTLKQKMQDDVAKAIIAKEGAPLTIQEHDAIVSKIKSQTAEAHAEMLACKEMVPIDKARPDAVRMEPIFRDNKGHMYWRLKGCSEKSGILLLQDVGSGDHTAEVGDKWFEFDDEQMGLIERHINVLRSRFKKHYKN